MIPTAEDADEFLCRTIEALELAGYRVLPEAPTTEMLIAIRLALGLDGAFGDRERNVYTFLWRALPLMSKEWKDHAEPVVGDLVFDVFDGKVATVPGKIVNIDENGIDIEWEGDNSDKINGLDPDDLQWDEERQGWLR